MLYVKFLIVYHHYYEVFLRVRLLLEQLNKMVVLQEHIESHYKVDPALFQPQADFLLRVNGMSMKDIGILDGDLLAVHKTTDVHNGQVVVARVDEDVTVKRLEKRGREVLLHAENEEFSPIKVDLASEPFSIEGIAVGVIRNADWM